MGIIWYSVNPSGNLAVSGELRAWHGGFQQPAAKATSLVSLWRSFGAEVVHGKAWCKKKQRVGPTYLQLEKFIRKDWYNQLRSNLTSKTTKKANAADLFSKIKTGLARNWFGAAPALRNVWLGESEEDSTCKKRYGKCRHDMAAAMDFISKSGL